VYSIDKTNSPIAYEAIGGYATSDDIATNNLITKVSFENAVTEKWNQWWVGTAVTYARVGQARFCKFVHFLQHCS
jgi:hypothetical protein